MNGSRFTQAGLRGPAAVIAVTAALALAGCGGSKSPSVATVATTTTTGHARGGNAGTATTEAPTTETPTTGTTSSTAPTSQAQLQQALLRYAECMRSNGVPNFPDPGPGGGFEIPAGSGIDLGSPAVRAAQAKCRKLMPGGGPPGPGSPTRPTAQALANMVKIARCMREHGISDFPDPRTSVPANPFPAGSPGGVISDIDGVILVFPATIDTQSPLFTHAAAECDFPLHNH